MMKIQIHPRLKRPWGVEVPYTYISDTGEVHDGSLLYLKNSQVKTETDQDGNVLSTVVREVFPEPKVTEEDVLAAVKQVVSETTEERDKQMLLDRKAELESELSSIEAELASLSEQEEQKEIK